MEMLVGRISALKSSSKSRDGETTFVYNSDQGVWQEKKVASSPKNKNISAGTGACDTGGSRPRGNRKNSWWNQLIA